MISSTPLFSSLYNSSTYSAHLSITSSFSIKTFPCLLLIVCNPLFPFGRSSLISGTLIGCVPYPTFQSPCTYLHNICLWLADIAFESPASASYTVLHPSCFCIFFFPPSYAISLSSSNSAFLAASPSHKSPLQLSKYPPSTFSKFHLLPHIHQFFPPVVVDQAAFYMQFLLLTFSNYLRST